MKAGTRRVLVWGTIAAAVVVLFAIALYPRAEPVDVVRIGRGGLQVSLEEEGKTRVRHRYVVSAPVAGRVLRIELEPGDRVVAGETVRAVFAPAEPSLLDARTRRESEARVRAARAAVERARSEEERVRSQLALAEKELARSRELLEAGAVPQERLDQSETQVRSLGESAQAAEAGVEVAGHELEQAQAALDVRTDEEGGGGSSKVVLHSPVDGEVLQRLRESSAVVGAGEPLLEVADPDELEIVADYLSTDAVRIRPGDPARIERWGGERALVARVRRVEPYGFTKVSALGVEEQRVNVILDFADPHEAWSALGDGYRVETRVIVWQSADVLKVPVSALFRPPGAEGETGRAADGGQGREAEGASGGGTSRGEGRESGATEGWAVFLVREGRAVETPVRIGHRSELEAEVLDGLDAGEQVIVHPGAGLEDGVRVEVSAES